MKCYIIPHQKKKTKTKKNKKNKKPKKKNQKNTSKKHISKNNVCILAYMELHIFFSFLINQNKLNKQKQ